MVMNEAMVIDLARQAVTTILLAASPMMLSGLATGLLVSIFQAATQINEQTMTFVPKIVAVLVALIIAAPWILNVVVELAREVFGTLIVITGAQ
jgi:flagellar biosynthetic protein FliQ